MTCPAAARTVRVIGMMSGTSHDAIDAAAADCWTEGDDLVLRPLGMVSTPYSEALRAEIIDALPPSATTMAAVCRLDTRIGQAFADLAERAVDELCGGHADLIVSHGQTVFHWVEGQRVEGTLQLGQPAWIAERTGCTVVADLRPRDVAAGGQGAPLVSMVDALWLTGRSAAAVNLGGIANATLVNREGNPIAFDTGPANALIDAVVHDRTGGHLAYDRDGALAAAGRIDDALLNRLLTDPYYARPTPKTTGKELFHLAYLDPFLAAAPGVSLEDLVATLTALTARTVADTVRGVGHVILSGGGTRNPELMRMIREELPDTLVELSDDAGFPSDAKEALAFAVLGLLTVNGQVGTVPSSTGARHASVLGAIVPGTSSPPRILDGPPARLRFAD